MKAPTGRLFLVPNTLDFGTAGAAPALDDALPLGVIRTAAGLGHWVAENAKTTRAFLKRVDAVVPLARPLQRIVIVEWPRDAKGAGRAAAVDADALLEPALRGSDLGLISEAGLPAVADPGALLVAAAHANAVEVVALSGPNSLVLALAASGLQGQCFAFIGYLPIEPGERGNRIRDLEALSRRHHQTQLMIETPYRNPVLLGALLAHLQPGTRLAVSCGLTLARAFNRSDAVGRWRSHPSTLPTDVPAVFSFLAG